MAEQRGPNKALLLVGVLAALAVGIYFLWSSLGRRTEAYVSGKVTLDGTPLAGAQIVFIGEDENHQTPIPAQADDVGTYRLIGPTNGGIPPGAYRVVVTRMALPDGTVPTGEKLHQAREDEQLVNQVPAIYEDRSSTPLRFDIPAGQRSINLELTKQPAS